MERKTITMLLALILLIITIISMTSCTLQNTKPIVNAITPKGSKSTITAVAFDGYCTMYRVYDQET